MYICIIIYLSSVSRLEGVLIELFPSHFFFRSPFPWGATAHTEMSSPFWVESRSESQLEKSSPLKRPGFVVSEWSQSKRKNTRYHWGINLMIISVSGCFYTVSADPTKHMKPLQLIIYSIFRHGIQPTTCPKRFETTNHGLAFEKGGLTTSSWTRERTNLTYQAWGSLVSWCVCNYFTKNLIFCHPVWDWLNCKVSIGVNFIFNKWQRIRFSSPGREKTPAAIHPGTVEICGSSM